MKKALIVAGIAACTMALCGCGTLTELPNARTEQSVDETYLTATRTAAISLTGIDSAALVKSGKAVCGWLETGRTGADLFAAAKKDGLTEREASAIIDAAIDAYCPEESLVIAV